MATVLSVASPPNRMAAGLPESLILSARDGDREALGVVLERIERWVFTLAYRLCGNLTAAEDIAQEALYKICRHIGRYRSGSSFLAWVHRIVVNQAYDHHRASKPTVSEGVELAVPPDVDPVRSDQLRRVLRAMSVLTPRERAALVMIDIEGYSSREAAAVLGCLAITARTRAAHARKKIRTALSRDYPELREVP